MNRDVCYCIWQRRQEGRSPLTSCSNACGHQLLAATLWKQWRPKQSMNEALRRKNYCYTRMALALLWTTCKVRDWLTSTFAFRSGGGGFPFRGFELEWSVGGDFPKRVAVTRNEKKRAPFKGIKRIINNSLHCRIEFGRVIISSVMSFLALLQNIPCGHRITLHNCFQIHLLFMSFFFNITELAPD